MEELIDEGPIYVVTGKPIVVIEESLLLIPNLRKCPGTIVTEEDNRQEFGDQNQTEREGPYIVKKGINDAV